MMNDKYNNIMDAVNLASFIISIMNLGENIDQNKIQELVGNAVEDLHVHMKQQDKKIDDIISMLEQIKGGQ